MDEPINELADLDTKDEMVAFMANIKERAKDLPVNCAENTKPHVAAKGLWMLAHGQSINEIRRVTGLGNETIRRLARDHNSTLEGEQKRAAQRYMSIAHEYMDRLYEWSELAADDPDMLRKVSPDRLAMTAGIAQDKALTLNGQATSVIEHRKGKSIDEALEIINAARARVLEKQKATAIEAEIVADA